MIISDILKKEINEYCRVNNITNIEDFKIKLIKQGFTVEKFGATPTPRIVERIVEVPKEKIVEKIVEKIIEVPVKVDNEELSEKYHKLLADYKILQDENIQLKNEVLDKTKMLEAEKNKKDIYGEK